MRASLHALPPRLAATGLAVVVAIHDATLNPSLRLFMHCMSLSVSCSHIVSSWLTQEIYCQRARAQGRRKGRACAAHVMVADVTNRPTPQVQPRLLCASNQVLGRTLAARADLLAAAGRHGEAAQAARGAAGIVAAAFGERAVQTALARRATRPRSDGRRGTWAC